MKNIDTDKLLNIRANKLMDQRGVSFGSEENGGRGAYNSCWNDAQKQLEEEGIIFENQRDKKS